MNFQHLMYFREIAIQGSVTKASLRLKIAQPALSIQLKQFEQSLGTQLFRREGRKMILTPMGDEVLRLAHQVHQSGQQLRALKETNSFVKQMRFGVLDNIPKNLVADLALTLKNQSRATVSILEGEQDRLLRELISGALEFVVTEEPITQFAGKQLLSKVLLKKELKVFGVKKFLVLQKDFPRSLHLQKVILPTEHSKLRSDLEHFFSSASVQPIVAFESQDTMVQKMMALKGEGVVFLPYLESEISTLFDQLKLVAEVPQIVSEFYLVTRPESSQLLEELLVSLKLGN